MCISKTSEKADIFYENDFSFKDFLKLDKTFKICDKLDDIFKNLLILFNEKKIIIKEIKDDSMILNLKLFSMTGKEKIVEMKLFQKEMNQDSIIKELNKKIKLLEEENKNLKEEIKTFKKEFNELNNLYGIKTEKNEKVDEIKKLMEKKKNNANLEKIDSKILTKPEEFEFIEKALKNNVNLLKNKIFKPKLLYRATRDGDSSKAFHFKCDKIKGTLTLVKTKKAFIFGGYTNQIWEDSNYENNKADDDAFCFSVDLKKIYKSKKSSYSIKCNKDYGPIFGSNFFLINDYCLINGGKMDEELNKNYEGQEKVNEMNNGETNFGIIELEVFDIIYEKII